MNYYQVKILGLTRNFPLVSLSPRLKIASFNLLGDGELVECVAREMEKRLMKEEFDYLVGPEVKVVPLLQVLSQRLQQPRYIVLRKNVMGYMIHPLMAKRRPTLVLDGSDAKLLPGKKVVIIDDVVSTGQTIEVVAELMKMAGAAITAVLAIFKQGEEPEGVTVPFSYLGKLPYFPLDSSSDGFVS